MTGSLTLEEAQRCIAAHLPALRQETVPLACGLGRVLASAVRAPQSYPAFDQSIRDGYAIAAQAHGEANGLLYYRLNGEIAAGDVRNLRLQRGHAHPIMTGALVPRGCWKVVPQEQCQERDGMLILSAIAVRGPSCIQRKGAELRRATVLLKDGNCIDPARLSRMADAGVTEVQVHRRPRVSFFCSGSELVRHPGEQVRGQKVSSNAYLLGGLIRSFGGRADDGGAVRDDRQALHQHLLMHVNRRADVIVSTGGMGPGRYDLMEETFARCGGMIVFGSLKLRPGKAVLFGVLGDSLYFALPGPPSAVHALFHVLLGPTLLALQGLRQWRLPLVKAQLQADATLGRTGVLRLREAVLSQKRGMAQVTAASGMDAANSYLFCPAGRKTLRKDEQVRVLPWAPPPYLSLG